MQYHTYEAVHALLAPYRHQSRWLREMLELSGNPLARTPGGKLMTASLEMFESLTRRYGKPEWGLDEESCPAPATEEIVWRSPFCDLLHFVRHDKTKDVSKLPKVLMVAPMSGHYATLLRGTVEAMLPHNDIYVTDWRDARDVPLTDGEFDLDSFIDHVIEMVHDMGAGTHVVGVCQPSVPVLAATAVMSAKKDPLRPASITLMGGPIDTRRNPTAVNEHAANQSLEWFDNNVISRVPFGNLGFGRRVYPGFMQLSGFMAMNLERHLNAHVDLFGHLVEGDLDSVDQHRRFYDEYMSVMDLPAEFFLSTVETVFQQHALPDGTMMHRGARVDPGAIRDVALMTVEGGRDDICGVGQTSAAHDLCNNLPDRLHTEYLHPSVGHYGVFNGTRWRTEIQPRIQAMINQVEADRRAPASKPAVSAPATKAPAKNSEAKTSDAKTSEVKAPEAKAPQAQTAKAEPVQAKPQPAAKAPAKKRRVTKTAAAKPEMAKTEAAATETAAAKVEAPKLEAVKPEVPKSEAPKSEAPQFKASEPRALKPNAAKFEAAQTEAPKPETQNSEAPNSEAKAPAADKAPKLESVEKPTVSAAAAREVTTDTAPAKVEDSKPALTKTTAGNPGARAASVPRNAKPKSTVSKATTAKRTVRPRRASTATPPARPASPRRGPSRPE